jgi:hypothetical protein
MSETPASTGFDPKPQLDAPAGSRLDRAARWLALAAPCGRGPRPHPRGHRGSPERRADTHADGTAQERFPCGDRFSPFGMAQRPASTGRCFSGMSQSFISCSGPLQYRYIPAPWCRTEPPIPLVVHIHGRCRWENQKAEAHPIVHIHDSDCL